MNEYNKMPEDINLITRYEDWQEYFTYCKTEESRRPFYNDNFIEGTFHLQIYWINKELNLGYCIKEDWKEKVVTMYKIGTEENWIKFKRGFGSQFRNDNS
jgi:hypothetical protein